MVRHEYPLLSPPDGVYLVLALMTRFLVSVAAASLISVCIPAQAQFRQVDGTYMSSAIEVRVILLDGDRGVAAASAMVVSEGCSGAIAGVGHFHGRTLTVTPYEKVVGGESCRLDLQFDAAWKSVRATSEHCAVFSGPACGFEGQSAEKRDER